MSGFSEMVLRATAKGGQPGHLPYPYQERLANEGLPPLLSVPTGAGKTLAATLPWLYRRRLHPDKAVREATPRRLVIVLPQRGLVEQTHACVWSWLQNLGLLSDSPDDGRVGLHLLLGGASSDDRLWKLHPEQDAIIVGTQDMVLSRLLMRGYAEPRTVWPMSFGLLHNDSHFVFDEIQLMGPALPTSLQLEGLRRVLGTALPSSSTWMSATLDRARLSTVDAPDLGDPVGLSDRDRTGALARRLDATRLVSELDLGSPQAGKYPASLAKAVLGAHRPGTRTIVVLNTVGRAQAVYAALGTLPKEAAVVLLHSRFRPLDRRAQLNAAVEQDVPEGGLIVVTTQVLEAGVDVTSDTLVTELAPWSSVVQRAGRCNRDGRATGARLLWVVPPGARGAQARPYEPSDLDAAATALRSLEGDEVTSTQLGHLVVDETRPLHAVLRRRDLIQLFDTAPDLFGNDIDISRWVRDADERTVSLAWRSEPHAPDEDTPPLTRDELCPAPVGEVGEFLKELRSRRPGLAWVNHPQDGWREARPDDVRPGAVLLLDGRAGGYEPETGWTPSAVLPGAPVAPVLADVGKGSADEGDPLGADPNTAAGSPVLLGRHLEDVRDVAASLIGALAPLPGLSQEQAGAVVTAAYLHDLGKAHEVFQRTLSTHFGDVPWEGGPWAKSPGRGILRHERPGFRHELVGALLVLDPTLGLAGHDEPDLTAYLIGAHHGKVRLTVRPPDRGDGDPPGEDDEVLGVRTGDTIAVHLPDGRDVHAVLDVSPLRLGDGSTGASWTTRACALRDREDLGPFRLAFLEALVRAADWLASSRYDQPERQVAS